MFKWLRRLFGGFGLPKPAGPPELVRAIGPDDAPISQKAEWDDGELEIESDEQESVRLFEVTVSGLEQCMLTYRFQILTHELEAAVYPELWCRIPGQGEFFSRGTNQKIRGSNDWVSLEIPFYLKADQTPDLLKLNLVFEGEGIVRLREIEVYSTPLEG